jgi:hypothetical protein
VLFNLSDAKDLGSNAKNLDAVWVTNACLDYLHRLPHKPRVTLLLTQIDRYVDLEQYEFDPKVYVSHHLPLIARNFPNLDVCAVAALGAAASTFGIDSILVRCLFNTPTVQKTIQVIQECRKNFNESLQNLNELKDLIKNLKKVSCSSSEWRELLPWFIQPKNVVASSGLLEIGTYEECIKLINDFSIVYKQHKGSRFFEFELRRFLQKYPFKSKEGKNLSNALLNYAVKKRKQAAWQEASEYFLRSIPILIIVIIVIFVVVVIVLAGERLLMQNNEFIKNVIIKN